MFKHWRTTLLGAITGLVMIIKGILSKNYIEVVEGVGIAITGALASDSVTTDEGNIENATEIEINKEKISELEHSKK